MSYQDRDYQQGGYDGTGNPVLRFLNSSFSIGRPFGIDVRVHALFILFAAGILLSGGEARFPLSDRILSIAILFGIVLLHEFGHCFAARWVGGDANQIVMGPFGGLAMTQAPHRPGATFITVAGGPLVNVAICIVMAIAMYVTVGPIVSLNPFHPLPPARLTHTDLSFYFWWVFYISYVILLFNLLPIFPMDGGQLLQSALWFRVGYYQSMMFACNTGLVGGIVLAVYGLFHGGFLVIGIAISGLFTCYQMKQTLREMGPDEFDYLGHDAMDFSASLRPDPKRKTSRFAKWAQRRAARRLAQEQADQQQIDRILEKVSATGMNSLTWLEKRTLRRATERQRQKDAESARRRV